MKTPEEDKKWNRMWDRAFEKAGLNRQAVEDGDEDYPYEKVVKHLSNWVLEYTVSNDRPSANSIWSGAYYKLAVEELNNRLDRVLLEDEK